MLIVDCGCAERNQTRISLSQEGFTLQWWRELTSRSSNLWLALLIAWSVPALSVYDYAWFVCLGAAVTYYLMTLAPNQRRDRRNNLTHLRTKQTWLYPIKPPPSLNMPRTVKCGLIQCSNAAPTDLPVDDIKRLNIEKHLGFIEQAAAQGVQILCMQEVFTTPYFCAEQQTRWYEAVEKIPDGPTVRLMQEVARAHGMVIIVPIYEEEIAGIYYNTAAVIDADGRYLGKYRKNHISRQYGFYGKSTFARQSGYPAFDTAFALEFTRSTAFPEGAPALV